MGPDLTPDPPAAQAALALVLVDPAAATEAAAALLSADLDAAARAVALRALGQAWAETGHTAAAARQLREAVAWSARHGLVGDEIAARISLSGVLAARGRITQALRELDRAPTTRTGPAPQVAAQRGFLLARAGRGAAALDCYRDALPRLRRAGDRRFEAIHLLNRGALLAERGDLAGAERDLRRCAAVAEAAGFGQLVADAQNNLGYVAALAGDLPTAFVAFDAAQAVPGTSAAQAVATRLDHARALLCARMALDATAEIERALPLLEHDRHGLERAEAELLLAEAALGAGDPESAGRAAAAAFERMRKQRRHGWAALAGHLAVRARFASGERGAALLRAVRSDLVRTERAGWRQAAVEARILGAVLLIELRRPAQATAVLAPARTETRSGPARLRITAWHAEALRCEALGDRTGALRAARTGLRLAQTQAAICGADDLRAHAADNGSDLAQIGLRLSLDRGDATAALRWSEAYRAAALLLPAIRPPEDPLLASDLMALRANSAALTERIATGGDPRELARERDRLEAAVAGRLRQRPGHGEATAGLDPKALAEALADRGLVSFVVSAGRLWAVSLLAGRTRLHDLGTYAEVVDLLEAARFALLRTAGRRGGWAPERRAALDHAVAALDARLCEPLRHIGDRDLVLVPTADLFRMPWSLLPSWRGRPTVVAPSARLWLRAASPRRRRSGKVLLVAGPGLSGANEEICALEALHPGATVLSGPGAASPEVLRGLAEAELAHLACHGEFRDENPLFSSFSLADGPLIVHELSALRRTPRVLVLSACDSARCAIRPGDELLGATGALLSAGTRTVIAAVSPVDDTATVGLMVDLHRRLRSGLPAGRALAEAAEATDVHGFVCLGAD